MATLMRDFNREGGQSNPSNMERIKQFLAAYPNSPFSLSLLLEQAEIEWKHGYFTDALDTLRAAWTKGKDHEDIEEKRLGEIAYAELSRKLGQLGQREELRTLIGEGEARELGGTAAEALIKAKETLWFFDNQAEQNVFCGFTAANAVCVPLGHPPIFPDVHDEEEKREFIANGLSLYELKAHSHEAGGNLQLYKRGDSPEIPVPSVIHWDFNHYSAITERDGDLYRVKDFHLKVDTWVSLDALNQQSSGYFAVEGTVPVPAGYTAVEDAEAKTVFGRHCTHGRDDEGDDCGGGGNKDDCAMATYSFRLLNPGLELFDTPISYTPPFGPEIKFQLNYDQRSSVIPDLQDHGNFGPRWTYDYLTYIDLVGSGTPASSVEVVFGNGSYYRYSYNTQTGTYGTAFADRPRLDYITAGSGGPAYQMTYSDGSVRIYAQSDATSPSRFYLTEIVDPQGNAVSVQYDANLRITGIIDALGQTTNLSYTPQAGDNVPTDTNKIRSITDPFGRTALFKYTTSGQLFQIIDPEGIVSEFSYTSGDLVDAFTTPYGTWTINWGTVPNTTGNVNGLFLEVTDPYGDKERVEQFDANTTQYNPSASELLAPSSVNVDGQSVAFYPKNNDLNWRNTFYWDKQQMRYHAGDYSKAVVYNWLAESNTITGVLGSMKQPEEGRVWYNYWNVDSSGNLVPHTNPHSPGQIKAPAKIVRAVENENGVVSWRMTQNEYDPTFGNLTKTIDPLGRQMVFEYNPSGTVPGAVTGIDLTAVKVETSPGVYETMVSYSNFVENLPQTVNEASGTTTSYQYNAEGQVTQITVVKGGNSETTKFIYDENLDGTPDSHGYLIEVQQTDPTSASAFVTLATYTYDAYGRVRTETNTDGYTLTYDYDNFDRVTLVTHPDGTTEQFVYEDLDLVAQKDRNGNWTRFWYDANRKLVLRQDPDGNMTALEWCRCGDIRKIIDPNGNVTRWKRDAQGRPYEKIYPDGTKTSFTYEALSGNLESVTYANDQASGQPTMTYRYFIDGSLAGVDHTDPNTPDVSYQYNDPLARLTAHTDQLGTTSYSYIPFSGSQNGAGELYEVNGPWAHDTARYAYDWQGRLSSRQILDDITPTPNFLHSVAWQYDSLGRLTTETNNLGQFTYQYNAGNLSPNVDAVQYPVSTGIIASYDYYPVAGTANDDRLKEIHTTGAGGATISKFNYAYDPAGRIQQWTQQQGTAASAIRNYAFAYDKASQLTDAVVTDNSANVLKTWSWQYDPAGNRVRESVDTGSTYAQFNDVNQLTQLGGAGVALIEGTVDEPSSVTVNSEPALVTSLPGGDFLFRREIPVSEGSNTVTIEATDASNNTATQSYAIVVGGVQKVLEYDLNGNLRYEKDDQGVVLREFQWDARNRLVAIIDGTDVSEFEYDALDRRVRIVEKENGVEVSNETYLWAGSEILQKRNSAATTVIRNYFEDGFTEGANSYFYAKDHLGSIREVVAADGTTIEARYEYTPWGEVTKIGGTGVESDFLYTGHLFHAESGLFLAQYRAYSPDFGRWLSRDPLTNLSQDFSLGYLFNHNPFYSSLNGLGELSPDGPNQYLYARSNPILYIDKEGKAAFIGAAIGGGLSFGLQFWGNGGIDALMAGDWDGAWQATKCVDYADVALSAGSGALGLGAIGNLKKAHGALKQAKRVRNMYSRYGPRPGSPGPRGYVGDAANQALKAGGKGAAGVGVNSLKDDLDYVPGDCDE